MSSFINFRYCVTLLGFIMGILLWGAAACTPNPKRSYAPERPSSIPAQARWVGGPDGGSWIVIDAYSSNQVKARIYFDDGELWSSGVYVPDENCILGDTFPFNRLQSFDGVKVNLNKGCSLSKK